MGNNRGKLAQGMARKLWHLLIGRCVSLKISDWKQQQNAHVLCIILGVRSRISNCIDCIFQLHRPNLCKHLKELYQQLLSGFPLSGRSMMFFISTLVGF